MSRSRHSYRRYEGEKLYHAEIARRKASLDPEMVRSLREKDYNDGTWEDH